MEPSVYFLYLSHLLYGISVYFKELHKEQEYYIQSRGSCSVNYDQLLKFKRIKNRNELLKHPVQYLKCYMRTVVYYVVFTPLDSLRMGKDDVTHCFNLEEKCFQLLFLYVFCLYIWVQRQIRYRKPFLALLGDRSYFPFNRRSENRAQVT